MAEVGGPGLTWGTSIQSFMRYVVKERVEKTFFHNLAFDGRFIIDHLFRSGYSFTKQRRPRPGQFNCIMSSKNKLYQVRVCFSSKHTLTVWDSYKLFPFSVETLGRKLGDGVTKGEIDHKKDRPVGYKPTPEEIDYGLRDVVIVAKALQTLDGGPGKMTIGANALADYKDRFGKNRFRKVFPVLSLEEDAEVRAAYRGGYTYVRPDRAGKVTGAGISVDYNSMFPSQMWSELPYPVGYPERFEGRYSPDTAYPLYVQRLTASFRLKPRHVPTIQVKGSAFYGNHEYVEQSVEPVSLALTSVDLDLFFENYDVDVWSWDGGLKFMAKLGEELFGCYYEHWGRKKQESEGAEREEAKLYNNSLYGKFATNPDVTGKLPYFDEETDTVRWMLDEPETREPVYIPVGAFTTAYARKAQIEAILVNWDRFVYTDTDSLHLDGTEPPEGVRLHEKDYHAWKVEEDYIRAKHLRAKCYVLEHSDGSLTVKCAGMPDNVKKLVTFDTFEFGFTNAVPDGEGGWTVPPGQGKLLPKAVPGGVVLVDSIYCLHP